MTTASQAIKGPDDRLVAALDKHSRLRSRLETLQRLTAALASATTLKEIADLRLAQVLSTLIENAAKFTDRGGEIRVRASVSGGELIVSVIDNGIGIAPESLPRLFEMFSQIRSRDDRATDGMGTGLALVAQAC